MYVPYHQNVICDIQCINIKKEELLFNQVYRANIPSTFKMRFKSRKGEDSFIIFQNKPIL